jgi:hypothetical protein
MSSRSQSNFRKVTGYEFRKALADCAASPLFREVMSRLSSFDESMDCEAAIHVGPLRVGESLTAPALCTLITGDLDVADVLDLCRDDDGWGLFIVIGNLRCRHFISDYGCNSIIDGDLAASESLINGFEDSGLWVTGTLRTHLFIGADIWAEVGAGAVMDYGEGYCLPIGYRSAGAEAIHPLHSEQETTRIVVPRSKPKGYLFDVEQFVDLIRAGKPIFR